MRRFFLLIPLLALGLTGCTEFLSKPAEVELAWETDMVQARAKAKAEGKLMLLCFTQSDSCAWCQRLDKEAFSQELFAAFARANLVLVSVDFSTNKTQVTRQAQANHELAKELAVRGYPTLVLLDKDGKSLGRTGYLEGGAMALTAEIKRLAAEQPATVAGKGLRLQGVSGRPGHRLALINNHTVTEGESAKIDRDGAEVKIQCLSISRERVMVLVEGQREPAVLQMGL